MNFNIIEQDLPKIRRSKSYEIIARKGTDQ